MVQLDCIQEVQVTWIWHLSILATFAPLLGQTSNVQRPPSLPHSQSAREKQQLEVVRFPPQFLSCTISSLSIWTLPPCLNLPGPDAQVRVDRCLGTSEQNTGMSSTRGPLCFYPELWNHFTSEIRGRSRQHTRNLWMGRLDPVRADMGPSLGRESYVR